MLKTYTLLLSLLLLCALSLTAQEKYTVSGSVRDAESGETLIGATVAVPAADIGTITNEYGFYSFTLEGGDSLQITYSYVGFQTQVRKILLDRDITLDVELGSGVQLDEVVVKANSFEEQLNSTEMSVEVITTKEARLIPVLLGESDILKTIQLKPGIPSGSEGTTGLFVRGGGSDQNLIVLDEAVVYNANHLFGFFSTFNTDAVKDLKIYKGGFPAQYGGRLSSVIDVKLKEGNNKKLAGSGGIGLIASRLTLEGPIEKEKSSFIVSGRRTYVDLLTRGINQSNADNEDYDPIPNYYFYDLNTKINFQFGEKDRLFLSGYFGRDVFGFDGDFFDFDFDWGNATGTARWNHVFNPKLFANTTFTYSDYQYNIKNRLTGFNFEVGSDIRDANFKSDFYLALNNAHTFRFGASVTRHQFSVGRLQAGTDDGLINFSAGQEFAALEGGAYFSDDWSVNDRLKINYGLRFSAFNNEGQTYAGLEPRFASRYILNERLSLKASYARMYQYLHLVASSGITLPTDIWYPSTQRVRPQRSDQVAAGFSYLLGTRYFLTVEGYYKDQQNVLEFVDGAQLFANDDLEQEFAIGKGRGYGVELSIEKKEGKLTGWIGYTLAFVERGEFNLLDDSKRFAQQGYFSPVFDRRHDLSVVAMYELSRRFSFTATFVYGSGDLRWLPTGRFSFGDVQGSDFEPVVPDYEERNNYRLPPYHRLDLGAVWRFFPRWGESDLTLSVINAYDRRNTFFIYLEPEFAEISDGGTAVSFPERIAAKQVSLFPILPSITWNFKF
ncbi:TonB-dependent receptor [Flavilitoribacter nigricans]|uniref:TonB-dependent receptor n=1 Tax=Flavilitoribacter nigricans (strain ATCC 23147 / DSM 23189 / NBRC 102662 / NCIMB 1420 / SS-2) TaxID=1122177 RepID=A0A2D0N6C2_FLAN2|nr:TonB-dependent receptor [Flavilitoribacter nigricans]PHN03930.1 TonB-dependent receptor [Flavilitoribacter nigricans DSM 23189 = NBRC 102662]